MTVSNANKQAICEKYKGYLEIIYTIGNKVMLMKQLYQYAQVMGIARNYSVFYSSIIDLVNSEILRKEAFVAFGKKTQLQMLVMRRYAIRYMEGKRDNYSVASVKKAQGNERILVSIFKNQYILDKIVPRIHKAGAEVSFKAIENVLESDQSTILYNKNQGLSALLKIRDNATILGHLDLISIDHDIQKLQETMWKVEEGLRKGSKASEGKGKGKLHSSLACIEEEDKAKKNRGLSKEERMDNYTFDTMLSFNAYVAQIKAEKTRVKITVLIFDIHDRSNIYKIAAHIACIYHMFSHYFKANIKLLVGVVSVDEYASNKLRTLSETTAIDFISKERKGTKLSYLLEKWKVSHLMQDQIEVKFVDYNITNDYLDGIKHANLMRR